MSAAPVHHLHEIECLFGGFRNASRVPDQYIRREDRTVKPVDHPAATNAANDADIRPRNFRHHIGNKEFRQAKHVGRVGRLFLHSHSAFPQPHKVRGKSCALSGSARKINRARAHPYYDGARVEIESTQAVPTTEQVVP